MRNREKTTYIHTKTTTETAPQAPMSTEQDIIGSFSEQSIKNSLSKSFNSESYNVSNEGKIHKTTSRRKKKVEDDDEDEDGDDRKKRDNMNDKIQELLLLVPGEYFQLNKDRSSGTKDGKPNKGQILTKGVEYIQDLQNKIDENNRKEVELIWKLKKLCNANTLALPSNDEINLNNTSAEIVLSEIGVGPLAGSHQPQAAAAAQSTTSPNNNFEYGGYDQYS